MLSLLSEQECVPKMEIAYLQDGFSRFTLHTRYWREFSEHPAHRDWECRAVGKLGNALVLLINIVCFEDAIAPMDKGTGRHDSKYLKHVHC
jgi:hypothetical protein